MSELVLSRVEGVLDAPWPALSWVEKLLEGPGVARLFLITGDTFVPDTSAPSSTPTPPLRVATLSGASHAN